MEAKKALERDWSSLLPEVLNLIAKNLTEITDFVRFRTVCKSWRFSTPLTDLPPQFPWILVKQVSKPYSWCYSIHTNKKYTIHAPNSLSKYFCGPSEGYLLARLCYTDQISLFNPLNSHEIALPPIKFNTNIAGKMGPWGIHLGEHMVYYQHGDYQNHKLSVYHLGHNNWSQLNLGSGSIRCKYFYLKHMVFILERQTGVTKAMDIATGTLVYVIPPTEGYLKEGVQYIVEASGDILRVSRHPNPYPLCTSERFDVYRLDANKSVSPCWVKVTSIGDQALFIDFHGALTVKANDIAGIKRNNIYFYVVKDTRNISDEYEVKRRDIETGEVKHLSYTCSFKETVHWFVPNLHRL